MLLVDLTRAVDVDLRHRSILARSPRKAGEIPLAYRRNLRIFFDKIIMSKYYDFEMLSVTNVFVTENTLRRSSAPCAATSTPFWITA